MSNYLLDEKKQNEPLRKSIIEISKYLKGEWILFWTAFLMVILNSIAQVYVPFYMGDILEKVIAVNDKDGLLKAIGILSLVYIASLITSYLQIRLMGRLGQNVLFKLRDKIFTKLQHLPLEFFNANKAGDLISRINNDTQKLDQALSEMLLRFVGSVFILAGYLIAMLRLDVELTIVSMISAIALFVITQILSPLLERLNKKTANELGNISAETQQNLDNFRVIAAFNRRNYFKNEFANYNQKYFKASVFSESLNKILIPLYDSASYIAIAATTIYGLIMLKNGDLAPGVFFSFVIYIERFYNPLRIFASIVASLQSSLAAWRRIVQVLNLKSNLVFPSSTAETNIQTTNIIEFKNVSFGYSDSPVLSNINLKLQKGLTYALVGPTGGGKSTTASLIARLYDPSSGDIYLNGINLKDFSEEDISKKIGFILQEPFLFSGNLYENIIYGNKDLKDLTKLEVEQKLKDLNLMPILERFTEGLDTVVNNVTQSVSLGQKQLIAFLRIILRNPDLLILDEATANVDTITEQILEQIINSLPNTTTKIIIAHRLNTIKNADKIFFIAGGKIDESVDFDDAINKIKGNEIKS